MTIVSEPTGSETTTLSDVGNETKTHIVKDYQDANYTLDYVPNSAQLVTKTVDWEDNRKQKLILYSNWDLTNTSEITPGSDQLKEKVTTSGYRSRNGRYETKGDHDLKEYISLTNEYREIKKNGTYNSRTNFSGNVSPSGSVTTTWVEGEDEPTVVDTTDVSIEGDGDAHANSFQFASTEVWPDEGEYVRVPSSYAHNSNEYFEIGVGAWGNIANSNYEDNYTAADNPNAKSILNRYGTIGYRVGELGTPATSHDKVATAITNPNWFDHTADFFAGFADNASFGLTYVGRSGANYLTGSQNLTNYDGAAYSAGGWAAFLTEIPGIAGAVKAAGKGVIKRGGAVYAQYAAKNLGDDAAGLAARHAAGDCSFWTRVIKGTMCFAAGTKVHLSSLPEKSNSTLHLGSVGSSANAFAQRGSNEWLEGGSSEHELSSIRSRTQQSLLVPIEDVPLGATVDAQNPDGTGFDAQRGIASDWQRIELVMHRSDGAILEAELLRHRSETELLEVGQRYELATDEADLSGWAQIVAIDDDVQLGDGEGNLVVSRFKTIARKEVVKVRLENGAEIVGTPGHRTWCVNRGEFIGLSEFKASDFVLTLKGDVKVLHVESGLKTQTVFNFEVEGQHVYRVGDIGLIVHNNGEGCERIGEKAANVVEQNIDELEFLHSIPGNYDFYAKLVNRLKRNGIHYDEAIDVVILPNGKKVIFDGGHRATALQELGDTTVPAIVRNWDEVSPFEQADKIRRFIVKDEIWGADLMKQFGF